MIKKKYLILFSAIIFFSIMSLLYLKEGVSFTDIRMYLIPSGILCLCATVYILEEMKEYLHIHRKYITIFDGKK